MQNYGILMHACIFSEDDDFLEEMCGKGFKTQQKPSRMDAYADVFEQMERGGISFFYIDMVDKCNKNIS